MGSEENLFRETFFECSNLISKLMKKETGMNITLPMYSIWSSRQKELRIYSTEPAISAGKILFSKHLPENAKTQLQDYPNTDRNDFLDAVQIMADITNPNNRLKRVSLSDFSSI